MISIFLSYSGFPKETPELKFRLRFFFRSATVCNSLINTHARRFYMAHGTWHGVMADGEEFMRWKISTNTVYGYKTDTKCAHSVRGRPTLKDEKRFRSGLVRKPYERSLYERTFMLQAGVTFSRSQIRCYVTIYAICHATLNVRIKVKKKR